MAALNFDDGLRPAEARPGSSPGRRHPAAARRGRAGPGPRRRRINRQRVADRRCRRPVRRRAGRDELFAAIIAAATQQQPGPVGPDRGRVPVRPVADHLERISQIIASAEDASDMRRRIGAAALAMDAASDGSWQARWRATVAARLPSQRWPRRTVLITAVDADTGEPVVFDRHSGVDLVDAVAASCASGLPYRIGATRYVDGGYRCNENAGLAAGFRRALVLSPFGQQPRGHVRRQSDGSGAASGRCPCRTRPRRSPCRASHRILALKPLPTTRDGPQSPESPASWLHRFETMEPADAESGSIGTPKWSLPRKMPGPDPNARVNGESHAGKGPHLT